MWEFISERLRSFTNATLSDKDHKYEYMQFVKMAIEHGERLKAKLPNKSKCAVFCISEMNAALALLSCWYADLVPVPISIHYGERHCAAILELIEPDCIIVDRPHSSPHGTYCEFYYDIGTGGFSGSLPVIELEEELCDVAIIMCTSGTTGLPKGAMLTAEGLIENSLRIVEYFGFTSSDKILIARPLYHCAVLTGEFLVSLYCGLHIVFYDNSYSPALLIDTAEHVGATVLCGTPTLFNHISLLVTRYHKKLSLKKIALSGECLKKEIAVNIRIAFPKAEIYSVYGLTEASPRVAYLPPQYFDQYPDSVGSPLRGIEAKIVERESRGRLSANASGILYIKSPSLMLGYYRNKELTNSTIIDGWLNTNDIALADNNGFLYILARADELIIKAGMNIYPREIESAVNTLAEVSESMAYGVNDTKGYTSIGIDIILSKDCEYVDKKILMDKLSSLMPLFQMPTQLNIVKSIPKNATGKTIRPIYKM
jgi:acyl-CoA synthetase (AMP-forming)/AMP-acid ligase II